jgi:hypothetical protein
VPFVGGDLEDLLPSDDEIRELGLRIARRVQERLRELVVDFTPVSDDPFREYPGRLPGTLRRSWVLGDVDVLGRGNRISVTVETFDPVAPHVEWDTAPHLIRPKAAREARAQAQGRHAYLAFRNAFGRLVFAREVLHPGTSGAHMMARALDALEAEWRVIAREEFRAWGRSRGRVR